MWVSASAPVWHRTPRAHHVSVAKKAFCILEDPVNYPSAAQASFGQFLLTMASVSMEMIAGQGVSEGAVVVFMLFVCLFTSLSLSLSLSLFRLIVCFSVCLLAGFGFLRMCCTQTSSSSPS